MKFALLIARQRSGTGALGSVLDTHRQLKYFGEVFHPDNIEEDKNFFNFWRSQTSQDASTGLPWNAAKLFESFIQMLSATAPDRLPVIDVKYRSLHHLNGGWHGLVQTPQILQFAMQSGAPIIHLTRKNYVESFVSGRLAEANRVWHAKSTSDVSTTSVVVDIRQLSNYITNTDTEVDLIQRWCRKYPRLVEIDYSELFDKNGQLAEPIANAISRTFEIESFSNTKPGFVKQAPAKLQDSIMNYDLVVTALRGTKHEWMVK